MLEGDIHTMVRAVRRVDAEAAETLSEALKREMRCEIVARFGSMESFNSLLRNKMLDVLTRSLAAFDCRLTEEPAARPRLAFTLARAPTLAPLASCSGAGGGPSAVSAAAVSVRWLLRFFEERVVPELGELATTTEVVARIIKPATEEHRCRYYELGDAASLGGGDLWQGSVPARPGTPEAGDDARASPAAAAAPLFFCSHAWARPFRRVVDSLVSFLDGADPGGTFVWVDIFAVNQHDPLSDLRGGQTLRDTIELSVGTFMVLGEDAHALTRLCAPSGPTLLQ